jgi:hypothetical protein
MNKRKNLSIVSVAGLASALAISAIGGSVAGNSPSMGGASSLGATEIIYETDGLLLSGESEDGRGEESGTQYAADETYDETLAGARLLLAYDPESNSFGGLVENTTAAVLDQVRVEVHLSNGTELGPTTPTDLAPGEVIEVVLPATDEAFDSFSAHPEIGAEDDEGEHGDEAEREHEDDDD